MTSQKCQVCNNVTTDPSARCYLHRNSSQKVGEEALHIGLAPSLSVEEDVFRVTSDPVTTPEQVEALYSAFDGVTVVANPQNADLFVASWCDEDQMKSARSSGGVIREYGIVGAIKGPGMVRAAFVEFQGVPLIRLSEYGNIATPMQLGRAYTQEEVAFLTRVSSSLPEGNPLGFDDPEDEWSHPYPFNAPHSRSQMDAGSATFSEETSIEWDEAGYPTSVHPAFE